MTDDNSPGVLASGWFGLATSWIGGIVILTLTNYAKDSCESSYGHATDPLTVSRLSGHPICRTIINMGPDAAAAIPWILAIGGAIVVFGVAFLAQRSRDSA